MASSGIEWNVPGRFFEENFVFYEVMVDFGDHRPTHKLSAHLWVVALPWGRGFGEPGEVEGNHPPTPLL